MRKDSVNVFSEGLVSDLNPLTTPNNVLTDCVNGTFITFNGDELALQNEAGNTKVTYKELILTKEINWTLNEATTPQVNFQWRVLDAKHNQFTNLITYLENKFQFLYLSLPTDGIVVIFNELDYRLYDSTVNDSLPEQEFYYIGTRILPGGETHKVYRKKDTFNTNNRVLFKVKLFYEDIYNEDLEEEPVSLPEGYLPIGIKEEGGILYIVSSSKPNLNIRKWNHEGENVPAYPQEYVYSDLLEKTYYKSIWPYSHSAPLPLENNKYWEIIGLEEDFNNYISTVQIGTYPSPEFSGETELKGKDIPFNQDQEINSIYPDLYRFQTINDNIFKPGRWVVFQDSENEYNHTNISRQNLISNNKRFYVIKLYNQLNNGYLDLTNDVWGKYLEHDQNEEKYWFRDSTFRYYCPNQYKGKLAIRLEIEDLDFFRLRGMTSVEFIPENEPEDPAKYNFKIKVETNTSCDILAQFFEIRTRLEGEINWSPWQSILFYQENNDYVGDFSKELDIENQYKIIEYEIKPDFYHKDDLVNSITQYLPLEYKNKYLIKGKRIISSDLEFNFKIEEYSCGIAPSFNKTIKKVSIKNLNDEYIDHLFTTSSDKYIYLLQGESSEPNEQILGTYTIDPEGYPEIIPPQITDEGNIDDINTMFSVFKVFETYSQSCQITEATFNFSFAFDTCSLIIMTVKQGSVTQLITPTNLIASGKPLNGFSIEIQPNILTEVTVNRPGYEEIKDSFIPTGNIIRNYAFISNVVPQSRITTSQTTPYEHFLRWSSELGLMATVPNLTYQYFKKNEVPSTVNLVLQKEQDLLGWCRYESNKKPVFSNSFTNEDSFTIITPGQQPLSQNYANISNNLNFVLIPGRLYNCGIPCIDEPESDYVEIPLIFRRKIDPKLMLGQIPEGLWINITVIYVSVNQGTSGNGLSGSLIVGEREYSVPVNLPQSWTIQHGPLTEGTYNINGELLVWYGGGMAQMSYKSHQIQGSSIINGGLFDIEVTDSDVNVTIYVSSNSESIQI